MTAEPAISVAGLRKSFKELEVLRGVDFEVAPGSIFACSAPTGRARPPRSRSSPRLPGPTPAPSGSWVTMSPGSHNWYANPSA